MAIFLTNPGIGLSVKPLLFIYTDNLMFYLGLSVLYYNLFP